MKNPCIRYSCVQCCLKTEMPLLKKDIERIKKLGFNYHYFIINKDGWLQLKNYNGKCVFNDGKQCLIYKYRPEGCKSYPIIYDEIENCSILDKDCPHRDEFKISEIGIEKLQLLIRKLEDERKKT